MTVTIRFPRIQEQLSKAKPPERFGLLDPNWIYTPASQTDVTTMWRRYGWKPANEQKEQK